MKQYIYVVENIFKGEGNHLHLKIDRVFWDKQNADAYAERENIISKEHDWKAGEFKVKSYPIVDFPVKATLQ